MVTFALCYKQWSDGKSCGSSAHTGGLVTSLASTCMKAVRFVELFCTFSAAAYLGS